MYNLNEAERNELIRLLAGRGACSVAVAGESISRRDAKRRGR